MGESRQLSVRLSDEVFVALEQLKPSGVSLAEVARKIITRVVLESEKLPALAPEGRRGPQRVEVDLAPILEQLAAVSEAQRELLRAAHEHGAWARRRHKTDAVMDQLARDDAERSVREWERSTGVDWG